MSRGTASSPLGRVRQGVSVSASPDLHGQLQQLRQVLPLHLVLSTVVLLPRLRYWAGASSRSTARAQTCCQRLMLPHDGSGMVPQAREDLQYLKYVQHCCASSRVIELRTPGG